MTQWAFESHIWPDMIDELRLGSEKKCVAIKKVEKETEAAALFEMIDCPTSPL